jgi:phosphatidylglycerophosphate synthase
LVRLIPDLLSLSRVVLAWPLYRAMESPDTGDAFIAALLFILAIATDLVDGPLARRLGTASARGRALDHTADAVFVIAGLAGAASRGALTGWLPVLVGAAFVQYTVDSWLVHRSGLRMSSLGRWNGILYFFPIGGDILVRFGLSFLFFPVRWLALLLCLTSLLSMAERARAVWTARRTAPGSLGGGTEDRSSR